jgi:ribosome-associated protein
MIRVTDTITLDEAEIEETFITAGGPGGQHVNKAATAVQIRFDAAGSPSLDETVRTRLLKIAGRRATAGGLIVITARRFRSQVRNREDAVERLLTLIREAAAPPVPRRATRVPGRVRQMKIREKRHTAQVKKMRRSPSMGGEGE